MPTINLFDYSQLIERLNQLEINPLADALPEHIELGMDTKRYGDIPRWKQALSQLPDLDVSAVKLNQSKVSVTAQCSEDQLSQLHKALMGLHPWRKGPFDIAGIHIDTEWRSDFKWDRLKDKIQSLEGKRVLDVGCGSGYHCWRMVGAGR